MKYRYRGFFGKNARRFCPHSTLKFITKEEAGRSGRRLVCTGCGRSLNGPLTLVRERETEGEL